MGCQITRNEHKVICSESNSLINHQECQVVGDAECSGYKRGNVLLVIAERCPSSPFEKHRWVLQACNRLGKKSVFKWARVGGRKEKQCSSLRKAKGCPKKGDLVKLFVKAAKWEIVCFVKETINRGLTGCFSFKYFQASCKSYCPRKRLCIENRAL